MSGKDIILLAKEGAVAISVDNGSSWRVWVIAPVTPGNSLNLLSIAANSSFVIIGGEDSTDGVPSLSYSPNGATYSNIDISTSDMSRVDAVACSDGLCVAVGLPTGTAPTPIENASLCILLSVDGITWTEVPGTAYTADMQSGVLSYAGNIGGPLASAAINGDTIVVTIFMYDSGLVNYFQYFFTSTDRGVTWSLNTPSSITDYDNLLTTTHIDGKFYAGGIKNFGTFVDPPWLEYSTDGLTWSEETIATTTVGYGIGGIGNGSGTRIVAIEDIDHVGPPFGLIDAYTGSWANTESNNTPYYWVAAVWNGTVFCVTAVTSGFAEPYTSALTSTDGVTWADATTNIVGTAQGATTFNTSIPPLGAWSVYFYDDCCHLYTSSDVGANWYESHQNIESIGDDWSDLSIAEADNDYATMLSYDTDYLSDSGVGRLSSSTAFGYIGTWSFENVSAPSEGVLCGSGAVSGGGQLMLATSYSDTLTGIRNLWLSTDFGVTFNRTAVSLGDREWRRACFATGATIQYAASFGNYISKSTDGGTTWADLASGPQATHHVGGGEGTSRLRCSFDGSVVIWFDFTELKVWVTLDGGTTWNVVLDLSSHTPSNGIDCGLSSTGQSMIVVCNNSVVSTNVYTSSDYGSTWTTRVSPLGTGVTCNVSADGTAFVMATSGYYVEISTDAGSTWATSFINPFSGFFGVVASYIFPTVNPNPPPRGGYIIERFDNRVWPTVETVWAVDCGFTLAQPKPNADLFILPAP